MAGPPIAAMRKAKKQLEGMAAEAMRRQMRPGNLLSRQENQDSRMAYLTPPRCGVSVDP
jgi:hypothetical protein